MNSGFQDLGQLSWSTSGTTGIKYNSMATHYSILYASIRKVTQEKVSLGLLLFDEKKVYGLFSPKKLAGVKAFLSKEEFQLLHHSFDAIMNDIGTQNEPINIQNAELFKITHSAFSIDYINYLSRYKNNLITYSEPKQIELEASPENTLHLFEKLVGAPDERSLALTKRLSPIDQLTSRFDGKLQEHFNVHYILTTERVPNLVVPVKVDLIGRNGQDVFVRTIDTSGGPEKLANEISTFYVLTDTYRKNKVPFQDFLVAEEPDKKQKKQHNIWQQVRASRDFHYLDLSEAEKIMEYAIRYDVKPVEFTLLKLDDNDSPF